MSDILIRGMDMPDKDHIVLVEIDNNGEVFAAYDGGRTKLAQYKAIPVPPHGRLIDADALIREHRADNYDYAIYASYLVQNAPTIIPASE